MVPEQSSNIAGGSFAITSCQQEKQCVEEQTPGSETANLWLYVCCVMQGCPCSSGAVCRVTSTISTANLSPYWLYSHLPCSAVHAIWKQYVEGHASIISTANLSLYFLPRCDMHLPCSAVHAIWKQYVEGRTILATGARTASGSGQPTLAGGTLNTEVCCLHPPCCLALRRPVTHARPHL